MLARQAQFAVKFFANCFIVFEVGGNTHVCLWCRMPAPDREASKHQSRTGESETDSSSPEADSKIVSEQEAATANY